MQAPSGIFDRMKGVVVAAGYGVRFLPATKTIPKEMLPLVNRPSIDLIVEEFLASGITEILFVTSRRKKALEDYFDREIELEGFFRVRGETARLERIQPSKAKLFFVRQREMRGTGHALLLARPFVGSEPFVVAYADDLHRGEKPLARQLMDLYEETGCSVMATIHDPPDINRYGIISIGADNLHVTDIVEKPLKGREPSREASIGRYLYAPDFLDQLEREWEKRDDAPGEFWHAPALQALAKRGRLVYKRMEGERLDTGEPAGYIDAIIRYAESSPELKPALDAAIDAALARRNSSGARQ
jgi:UTP--glucose-1-phosphate uridylyltransferase